MRRNIQAIHFPSAHLFHVRIFYQVVCTVSTSIYIFLVLVQHETPCNPSPCGANALCKERNGAGSCACLPEYYGDPYNYCKPECIVNTDCDRSKACFNQKCKDPCPGVCGNNAECHVVNHSPSCTCFPGYTGNPITGCREPPRSNETLPNDF